MLALMGGEGWCVREDTWAAMSLYLWCWCRWDHWKTTQEGVRVKRWQQANKQTKWAWTKPINPGVRVSIHISYSPTILHNPDLRAWEFSLSSYICGRWTETLHWRRVSSGKSQASSISKSAGDHSPLLVPWSLLAGVAWMKHLARERDLGFY